MCCWFVTCTGYQLFDNNELSLARSGDAQVFQYGKTVVVGPVVEYSGDEEDGNVILPCRLCVKEVVAFVMKLQSAAPAVGGD